MKPHQKNDIQQVVDNLTSYLLDYTQYDFGDIPEVDSMRSYLMELIEDDLAPRQGELKRHLDQMRTVLSIHKGQMKNEDLDKSVKILEKYI